MASNIAKTPLMRVVQSRGYAQLCPVSGKSNYEFKTCTLPNKLVVASAENESPIARVSVVFRAGARNETSENLGVSHVLRCSAGLSTQNASSFAISRNIQQVGASLTATADRETLSYTLEGTHGAVQRVLPFLAEVASRPCFKPWELDEISNRLKQEIAVRPLQLRAIDLLHKAAFRRGLGNSLYIPKFNIGKISPETILHYVCSTCTSDRAAVIGLGIDQLQLTEFAQSLSVEAGANPIQASPYKGGEVRSDKGGDMAYVAIAGEGSGLENTKEALAFAVLQKAIGAGPSVCSSSQDNGPLSKAIGDKAASTAINVSYSGTGLFGVLVAAPTSEATNVVTNAVKFFKSGQVSEQDIKRGKTQLKASLLFEAESASEAIQCAGTSAVLTGNVLSCAQWADAVDSVSSSDVQQALKKASSSKLSIAAVGNLSTTPYLDEI